jgi:hypothetical protein
MQSAPAQAPMKACHHGCGGVAGHQTRQEEVDRQCRPKGDKEKSETANNKAHASSLDGDDSFLVLFFKKEQRFFLQKEAKTLIPINDITSREDAEQ